MSIDLTVKDCEIIQQALSLLSQRRSSSSPTQYARDEDEHRRLYAIKQNQDETESAVRQKIITHKRDLKAALKSGGVR